MKSFATRAGLGVGFLFALGCGGNQAPSSPQAPATTNVRSAGVEADHPRGAAAARDAALAPSMGAIFDAFWNGHPRLAAGGTKVAFRSNRDGYPQVYVADVADPRSKPVRVATTKNQIHDFVVGADQQSIVFSTDPPIDERYELYAVDLDGKNLRALPKSDPIQRDVPTFARNVPGKFIYSARTHEKVETRILATTANEPGGERPLQGAASLVARGRRCRRSLGCPRSLSNSPR